MFKKGSNIKGHYEKPYFKRPGWKGPHDVEGMSVPKAIMDHYEPGRVFDRDDVLRWVAEQGYGEDSHSGPCSQLMRNGYIGRVDQQHSWPRKFLRPFGRKQLQPTRYDAEGTEHEGQHRP